MNELLETSFDYRTLDPDTRSVVEQKTLEIRDRVGRAALNIFEIGQRLLAVKERIGHGHFCNWLQAEFAWSERAARRMMAVATAFKTANLADLKIGPSALYLLASDTVPDEVRSEFVERAKNGEPVTHAAVKEVVEARRVRDIDTDDDASERGEPVPDPFATDAPPAPRFGTMVDCDACGKAFPYDGGRCPFCNGGDVIELKPEPAYAIPADALTVEDLRSLIEQEKRFNCIYADPPWRYGNQATRAATDNHYPTMTPEEIAALPVAELAADDAHLHLWTTNAFLFDCKAIMEAWGFTYKSMLVWCKPQMGIGNYWRVSHEILLLGVRGRCPFRDRGQMSWVMADRTTHSTKPEDVRERIERVSPGPRLELFGRRTAPGWTVWGNQIARHLFDPAKE